jgi:predicted RNase H-like HicB family nuclease
VTLPAGFGSASRASAEGGVLVVVHPAGRLDDPAVATYWTEVPAFPACHVEGASLDEVVARTREAIARWIAAREGSERPSRDIPLRVELAL